MNNSHSNTESTNNSNRQNSPGYCKQKSRTVTFAADTTKCGKGRVPNLRNKGNDANNETIRSLNMVPVREIDAEPPAINAEQPLVLPGLQPLRGVPMTCL
jgi:hypothetical protein